ncbi:hypothetical protein FPHYL_12970 [Fusarium phyllophilum]|uniref:Uncharacterized protein n=1 Tax=Fusarium phyllophilum TaxID=47803 RepID=A0A8H5MPU6_9HYPO|nr:hypothetical protein FPHYL_12970 [Fusarium phyllophilum]
MSTIARHRPRCDSSNDNYNKKSSESLGFRNDNSSIQYQARKRDEAKQLAAIDAANQADAQRIQDKAKELDILRAMYKHSQERLDKFTEEFMASQNENKELKKSNLQLEIDLEGSQEVVECLQREVARYKLGYNNNLPLYFDGAGFILVDCLHRLALDFAAGALTSGSCL